MKTPIDLAKKMVFAPLANLRDGFFKKVNIFKFFNKTADIIFEYSKETALIMLIGDAISILSSHNEQINGLKKSDRENKDVLIAQERIERSLDLVLTIIPPFLLTRTIKKKLESFKITTKEAEELAFKFVGPGVGAHRNELRSIEYIRPVTETIIGGIAKISNAISNNKKLTPNTQEQFKKFSNYCKSHIEDIDSKYIPRSIEEITAYFDDMGHRVSPTIKNKLRNGKAYDEIQGMVNGLCIAGVIGYSILVSNVLMPILKNKISRKNKDKQLAAMGETRESIKRKKRFAYTQLEQTTPESNIFDTFNYFESTNIKESKVSKEQIYTPITPYKESKTFESFNTYSRLSSQPNRLRI